MVKFFHTDLPGYRNVKFYAEHKKNAARDIYGRDGYSLICEALHRGRESLLYSPMVHIHIVFYTDFCVSDIQTLSDGYKEDRYVS